MKILIVEDEPRFSIVLEQGLREQGMVVDLARDGVTGLKSVEADAYDAVVLDVMLPRLNGFQVLQAMRSPRPTGQKGAPPSPWSCRCFRPRFRAVVNENHFCIKAFPVCAKLDHRKPGRCAEIHIPDVGTGNLSLTAPRRYCMDPTPALNSQDLIKSCRAPAVPFAFPEGNAHD